MDYLRPIQGANEAYILDVIFFPVEFLSHLRKVLHYDTEYEIQS